MQNSSPKKMKSGKVTPNAKIVEKASVPDKQSPQKSENKSKPASVVKTTPKFEPIDLKTLKQLNIQLAASARKYIILSLI